MPIGEMLKTALLTNDDSRRNAFEAFIKNIYPARCGAWLEAFPSGIIALFGNRDEMFWNRATIHRILQCSFLMTVLAATPACAEQGFDNVAGSWSGSGSMKPSDGARERVRCKVDYSVKNASQSVKMNVHCASDAYKMDLSANIDQNGTALSGNWFESQYRQGGKVSGQNVNGLIEAKVESDTIIALLTVRTKGSHQTFVMEAPGAWVSQVSIDLVRDPP
jgi:hypothetical protein